MGCNPLGHKELDTHTTAALFPTLCLEHSDFHSVHTPVFSLSHSQNLPEHFAKRKEISAAFQAVDAFGL